MECPEHNVKLHYSAAQSRQGCRPLPTEAPSKSSPPLSEGETQPLLFPGQEEQTIGWLEWESGSVRRRHCAPPSLCAKGAT